MYLGDRGVGKCGGEKRLDMGGKTEECWGRDGEKEGGREGEISDSTRSLYGPLANDIPP